MKILIICYVYPPEAAPAGVMVRELAEDLTCDGHKVTVQTGWPNHPEGRIHTGYKVQWRSMHREDGYQVQRVAHSIRSKSNPPGRLWVYLTFAVSSFLNGVVLGRHDVVLCLSTPLFGVWTAWALAKIWRARFINVIFDLWPEAIANAGMIHKKLAYRIARKVDTWNCLMSDEIITLGEGMKDLIIARGVEADRVRILPFWVDAEKIRPLPRQNAWRCEHGIGPDEFVAIFAGTVGYASGAQILIDTAAHLVERRDILVLVVGQGPVKDELEKLAAERGLANIRFLPFQPSERLAEMQSAADVGLVTLLPDSGFSSVPSKVLGYMSAGRPVIASVPEEVDTARLVRHGGFGLVVPAQDAAALAQAIVEMSDDPERKRRLGKAAHAYFLEHFSRQVVVHRYCQMLQEGY